jgi:hypothetical protein
MIAVHEARCVFILTTHNQYRDVIILANIINTRREERVPEHFLVQIILSGGEKIVNVESTCGIKPVDI